MMNQLDRCKPNKLCSAPQFTWKFWWLLLLFAIFNHLFITASLPGRRTQQTITKTKTFAREIQNRQSIQVGLVVWGRDLKIEAIVKIIRSHAFLLIFSLQIWWLNCIFLTTWKYQRMMELQAVLRGKKAHLVSYYEKQYQHTTGKKKNINGCLKHALFSLTWRFQDDKSWLKPPRGCSHF